MDFLFYSLGTTGDFLPFLKIARELRARKFNVGFIGSEKFAAQVIESDIEFFEVSSKVAYDATYGRSTTWSDAHAKNHYNDYHFPAIKPTFEVIFQLVEANSKPVIVFQDVMSGARMAAVHFDLPFVQVILAPSSIFSVKSPAYPLRRRVEEALWETVLPQMQERANTATFERLVQPLINPVRVEVGLDPWTLNDIPTLLDSPAILALFPDWFRPKQDDWPDQIHFTGFILNDVQDQNGADVLADFIARQGAPLAFTFGTGIPVTSGLVKKISRLCDTLDLPGVLISSSLDQACIEGNKRPVLTMPAVPFSSLFRKARLIVHHGGIGTSAQAIAAAKPQLVSPYAFDQPDNAWCLYTLGVGNAIDFVTSGVNQLAGAVDELLNSQAVSERAGHLASLVSDGTESAVDYLLRYTAR